jgi:SAM-dependent methyltransferase
MATRDPTQVKPPSTHPVRHGPDREAALAQYRRRAPVYDLELALFEPLRREAVERLALRTGDTVLDLACGTGLSLPLLRRATGPRGRVVGVEQSPEMLALARRRNARHRWRNVDLVEAPVESALLPPAADAALFHFTHDVLQRPEAVANVMCSLRPGARVVAVGLRWAPRRAALVNAAVWFAAWHSISTTEGLDRPWRHLELWFESLTVEARWFGAVYLAAGVVRRHRVTTSAPKRNQQVAAGRSGVSPA